MEITHITRKLPSATIPAYLLLFARLHLEQVLSEWILCMKDSLNNSIQTKKLILFRDLILTLFKQTFDLFPWSL